MNKYGRLAMEHWRRTDPSRYSMIPNPEVYFSMLGTEAENQIQELAEVLAGPDQPKETYLAKLGRLRMALLQAEERVLAEMILVPGPEEASDSLDESLSLVTEVQA